MNLDRVAKWLAVITQAIALICIISSSVLAFCAFFFARFDHDLKLIALTGLVSQTSSLMATASTILVGRNVTDKHEAIPDPLPPGATASVTQTTQTQVTQPQQPD